MINTRIEQLRALMKAEGIDVYVIVTSDDHQSEYISEYYKTRVYMSGFTGSAGTMVVSQHHAGVWADGRYHVQAQNQLKETDITLFKMGLDGVPSMSEQVEQWLSEGGVIGFDGKTMSADLGRKLRHIAEKKNGSIACQKDLVHEIWTDCPALPDGKVWLLETKYTGKDRVQKLSELREEMKRRSADVHVLCALDEIAWLYNIRGSDVKHTPVVLAFSIVTQTSSVLYVDGKKLEEEVLQALDQDGVKVKDYEAFLLDVNEIKDQVIWCDELKAHYLMMTMMESKNRLIKEASSIALAKACKNEVELKNIRHAHLLDGAAFTKFMIWLKKNVHHETITELSASKKLADCRMEMGALDLSFSTIAAFNEHGAMMHYSATQESDVPLTQGLFLVDSGGQYKEGTTDITRTMAIGEISAQWKMYCTTVLKSMLQLSRAQFLYGCSGLSLDILAREPIWSMNLDYQCGTGHGVGYLLSVHEGPQAFRWHVSSGRHEDTRLEEGMILTNEPGLYFEGEFGCRLENELVVRKSVKNMYGQFMCFETVTMAPIDLEILDVSLLSEVEKKQLNEYHKDVYEKLSCYMNEEEKEVLKVLTRDI